MGQGLSDAARQIAAKISGQSPAHATLSLSTENRASISAGEAEAIRGLLEQSLRAAGLEIGESESKLRVTISEDAERYLLVAQLGNQVSMASWKKPPPGPAQFSVSIKRAPVWEQRNPILDIALPADGVTMEVLEPDRVAEYKKENGRWLFSRAIPNAAPIASRDPRGRFGEESSPYRLVRGRDYFEGSERGFFYTMADTGGGQLFAGVDGHTRLFLQKSEPVLVINDWGSDIAGITSDCGSKRQVLATAPTLDESQDHLEAFEFAGGSYAAVSEPLFLAGPVTALWPAEAPNQVTVVVHDKQTGMYEASRVTLACVP